MPPVRRIFPPPEPPAPPEPPPAPAPPTTERRDRLIVAGLTVLAAAAGLEVLASLLDAIGAADDVRGSGLTTASASLELVADLIEVVAWTSAVLAFRATEAAERARRLVVAAVLVALTAGIEIFASGLNVARDAGDDLPGTAVASDLVTLASGVVLLVVAGAAAAAFAGPRAQRDARLAWTAIGFAAFSGVQMVATGLLAVSFADVGAEGALLTGIWVTAIAQAFAIGAATVAGAGLLTPPRRDRLLNVALGLWGLMNLVTAVGNLVVAGALDDPRYSFDALDIAVVRVAALASLAALAGAVVVAEAFRTQRQHP